MIVISNRIKQKGAALLMFFFVVFAASATMFLSSVNTHSVEVRQFQDMRSEMEKAKQGLIAYAMNYHTYGFDNDGDTFTNDEGPGRLICPDVDNDGLAESNATDCTDNVRGRLPETFSYSGNIVTLSNEFADIDQQFWYVVSANFKEITAGDVNHTTAGTLSIDGEGGYVAVIIAPGDELLGQDRSSSPTAVSNYLEQDNLAGTSFINSYPANPDAFNDQVIGIKASELKLDEIRFDEIVNTPDASIYEPVRVELYDYYLSNGFLPASPTAINESIQDKGYGWLFDEGYMSTTLINWVRNSYPYVYYNIADCNLRRWWFLPESPYSPFVTYTNGSNC